MSERAPLTTRLRRRGEQTLSMAKLIYSAIQSLDGYVADEDGNFEWGGVAW